jgi:tetratricopeptide (TPR) repeat protein
VRALDTLERFRGLAAGNERLASASDGEWVYALSEIYLGRLESARAKLEVLANDHALMAHRSCAGLFSISKAMQLRTQLSFLLWLTGQPERALGVIDEVYGLPEQMKHAVSQICHIVWACLPLSFWAGDLEGASKFLTKLRSYLEVENIPIWRPIRLFHRAVLEHRQGNADAVDDMQHAIDRIIEGNMVARAPMYLGMLAQARLDRGEVERARTTLQRATAAAHDFEERWSDPELLRLSASVSFAEGDASAAEEKLQEATRMALQSGANFLALLAANDLAKAYLKGRRAGAARDILRPVLDRFTGGLAVAEVARASRLLQEAERMACCPVRGGCRSESPSASL